MHAGSSQPDLRHGPLLMIAWIRAPESNVSLTAFLGKTWSRCGQTPKATVTGKRAGVAATSALIRSGQLLFRLLDKRIASKEVIEFLGQMLRHHRCRHLIVVADRAPPHSSKKTRSWIDAQPHLHVFHLPAYSPDWNLDEKVWSYPKHTESASHQPVKARQPSNGLIHHADRGGQYAGKKYRKIISRAKMLQSMSRAGDCYDNAFMESCFGTIKTELEMTTYDSFNKARSEIREYINYYNVIRRHSAIDYSSPTSFETTRNH